MPDITMCNGTNCPEILKNQCFRYRAIPNSHQSIFTNSPIDSQGRCQHFAKIINCDKVRTLEEIQEAKSE